MTKTKLRFELLESRDVPTLFGNPWQQAAAGLTLSFAPDGVQYSNQLNGQTAFTSTLFTKLNATLTTAQWQGELLRAFDTWASAANINIGLVADSGTAFGPTGLTPGVLPSTFRIGAAPLGSDVISLNTPNDPVAGGYAGNIILNQQYSYSIGGVNGTYDLYSVALDEVANVLGLADSDASSSARYGHYSLRTGLSADDVTAIRGLYGVRPADAFEGTLGNGTLATASTLTAVSDPAVTGKTRVVASGEITTAGDVDNYKFTAPAGTTSFTVRLGTAGKSLLAGRIDVYNSAGQLVGSQTSSGPLQGDAVLTLTGVTAGATYTVKVSAARTDAFKIGSYQLRVGFGYDPVTEAKADPIQRFAANGGANNTLATALTLLPTAGFAANTHYDWTGRIESLSDYDNYRFVAPAGGGVATLTILSATGLSTSATVYNSAGQVVASKVLINWEGGMYRAQVQNLVAGATYYVSLKVQDPNWSAWSGNYAASIDFSQPLSVAKTVTSGVANKSSQSAIGLDIKESGGFRFNLSATSSNASQVNWMNLYIYDATGALVASWGTDGLTSTDTQFAFLKKGQYTIVFQPVYSTPSAATVSYNLGLNRLSDPIDPYAPPDPTVPPPPPPPPASVVDTGVVIIAPPYLPPLP